MSYEAQLQSCTTDSPVLAKKVIISAHIAVVKRPATWKHPVFVLTSHSTLYVTLLFNSVKVVSEPSLKHGFVLRSLLILWRWTWRWISSLPNMAFKALRDVICMPLLSLRTLGSRNPPPFTSPLSGNVSSTRGLPKTPVDPRYWAIIAVTNI